MLGIIVAAIMFAVYVAFMKKDTVESLYRAAGLMFFWYIIKGVLNLVTFFAAGAFTGPVTMLTAVLVIASPIAGAWLIKESCRGARTTKELNQLKLAAGVCLTLFYLGFILFV